ncbi:hypothetical protein HID58_002412 [Brassica napus]|uniref:Uncharacterized protein n=1 Tax=Brassica napus TaxID=3708 RepID=A0ABQ8EQ64_BRANA|nr:hypothetical protein HID58_002412 [Brassica napus]
MRCDSYVFTLIVFNSLFPDLKSGRCSSVVEARLLRFWEARNVKRGGELMSADLLFMEVNGTIIFVEITHVRCPPPAWLDGSNSSADLILRKPTWLPTLLVSLALCTTINCHNLDLFKQQKIVNALFPIRFPYVALDYEQEVETAKSSSAIKVTYELPNVIKEWSILRNKYTAAWMLDVSGSFSPCRRHFMLLKLKSARLKNMKNYNNYLEEGRSEDEAVQLYFQRLTMTTMLRMVVKRSVADFLFLVTTHHTHGILETFSYMFSLCCLGWKPMTKKLKFVA